MHWDVHVYQNASVTLITVHFLIYFGTHISSGSVLESHEMPLISVYLFVTVLRLKSKYRELLKM